MKIKLGKFELDLTAKYSFNKRANKDDLTSVLNELSLVYSEAARYNEAIHADAIAEDYRKKADQLYKLCEEMGAYKGL